MYTKRDSGRQRTRNTSIIQARPTRAELTKPSDRVFHALADPTRRAIFEFLFADTEQTVSAITARLGISRQAVKRHLCVLEDEGLATNRRGRRGRASRYSAHTLGAAPLLDWLAQYGIGQASS